MVAHPNRNPPEATATYLLAQTGVLLGETSKLIKAEASSPDFEKARRKAFHTARHLVAALKMMGPADAAAPEEA